MLQSARLVPVPWQPALLEVISRLAETNINWWLYGTAALAVRGIPIEPGDIDFNVDDHERTARIFDDLLVAPAGEITGWVARYGGRGFSHAIIEWLSAPLPEHDDPAAPYEQGPFIEPNIETVQWRAHRIRVPPLSATAPRV